MEPTAPFRSVRAAAHRETLDSAAEHPGRSKNYMAENPTKAPEIAIALGHWSGYVQSKKALIEAGVIRSFKAPEADFAEWLVAILLGGSLPASKSHPAFDVVAQGKRVQVKSVCKAAGNLNGYIVNERDRVNDPNAGASHYAFVFFRDLELESAFLLPEDVVRAWHRTQIHQTDLLNHPLALPLWPT
jgi:hypothetical protein